MANGNGVTVNGRTNGNGNGNGNGLSLGAVATLCLGMLVISNTIMFWGLHGLQEQLNEKSADRYTGAEAEKDQKIVQGKLDSHEWRIEQVELYIRDRRTAERRSTPYDP